MPIDPQTRQRLLELVYDLLPATEAAELRRRIGNAPELARAYSEVRKDARLLSEAAKVEGSAVTLRRPTVAPRGPTVPIPRHRWLRNRLRVRWPLMRGANWIVGLLAAVFASFSLGGYWYHYEQLSGIAAAQLRLLVTGPSSLQRGVPAMYTVHTSAVTGAGLPAQVEFAIRLPNGQRLWRDKDQCDDKGRLQVRLPADLKIPPDARLDILAVHQNSWARLEEPLFLEPARYAAALALDKAECRPGETLYYRTQILSRLGWAADREFPVVFEALDAEGSGVAGLRREGVTEHGVGCGQFTIPETLGDGRYRLVAKNVDRSFSTVERDFWVRRAQAPEAMDTEKVVAETGATTSSATETPPLMVAFYPEGGELAGGVENRVYFMVRDAGGKPAAAKGTVCDSRGSEVAAVVTDDRGLGLFRFTPLMGESFRMKIVGPGGARAEVLLPGAAGEGKIAMSAGPGVFEPEEPLKLTIRSGLAGLPLVVAVRCRGTQVAQEPLVTSADKAGGNSLALPLAADVAGVLRVTAFDCRKSPPVAVAERLVYRRPSRRLNIHVGGLRDRYAPGEKVEATISLTNEQKEPVSATLGIAAVEGGADYRHGLRPSLAAYCQLAGNLDDAEMWERADFFLATESESHEALDLVLGTRQWKRPPEATPREASNPSADATSTGKLPTQEKARELPVVFDNIEQLRENYRNNLATYRAHRTRLLSTLSLLGFLGGLGLVVLVAMLVLMRVATGMHLWVTSILTAVCCVAVGYVLADPDRLRPGSDAAVAFASFDGSADSGERKPLNLPESLPEAAKKLDEVHFEVRPYIHKHGVATAEPSVDGVPTLLWQPLVVAKNGKAEIRFDLSDATGRVLILIDAQGDGRIGSQRVEILVEKPAGAKN